MEQPIINDEQPKECLLSKWHLYTKDLVSPNHFIDFGFYAMISASLQRRVWYGPPHIPIFSNLYVVNIGPPGVGKGLIIGTVSEFLKYHTIQRKISGMSDLQMQNFEQLQDQLRNFEQEVKAGGLAFAPGVVNNKATSQPADLKRKTLFNMLPDSTTFEALINEMSKHQRVYKLANGQKHPVMAKTGTYLHSSVVFLLEELSSLFRKKQEDVSKFLLNMYDCKDYTYTTKTQGDYPLENPCVTMLAGTTPGFIEEGQQMRLMADGLFSRILFVYGKEERFQRYKIRELNEEQIQARQKILDRLKYLSSIWGQVTETPEAEAFFTDFFEQRVKKERMNTNIKLDSYYARKKVNALKLSLCIHFSDKDTMELDIEDHQKALAALHSIEPLMHLAFAGASRNPLAAPARMVLRHITMQLKSVSFAEMWEEVNEEMSKEELEQILGELVELKKIKSTKEKDGIVRYWRNL